MSRNLLPLTLASQAIRPVDAGAVLEQVWIGRQANDIVRPDGEVAVKASGKEYKCLVCMVMRISDEGMIERIDEYYNRRWDDGVAEEEYKIIKDGSLKK